MKPLLAATPEKLEQLKFPLLASPKLDGFRAIIQNGTVYSRRLKPIPNKYIQEKFSHLSNHDGELIFGSPTSPTCFRDSTTAVMTQNHISGADTQFYGFDHFEFPHLPYTHRVQLIDTEYLLEQTPIYSPPELLEYEQKTIDQGYEGVILRSPQGIYKFGRSTMREQYLIKLKRFVDAEFPVIGFEEQMHNSNPAQRNEIGQLKRSSHSAGMVPKSTLGSLLLKFSNGMTMSVGSGFTDEERIHIWNHQEIYLGRLAKIKWFPVGMKDLPRHPIFLGWRIE